MPGNLAEDVGSIPTASTIFFNGKVYAFSGRVISHASTSWLFKPSLPLIAFHCEWDLHSIIFIIMARSSQCTGPME